MRVKSLSVIVCLFGLASVPVIPANAALTPEALARSAVSPDRSESIPAVAALRTLGPKGLDLLFQVYGQEIARLSAESARQRASDPEWQRLTAALDAVSQQRDSFASHLYWYTDLEQAKAAARASGRPILSLRLLGNLNEEFSCANSRFFRSILYANTEVSAVLRAHFILHWKSVRPVPRVTIDYGDGRKLERTLTGNSIHYVLDAEGRPIDAIPGLYGPGAFLKALDQALTAFRSAAAQTGSGREASLRAYHHARKEAIILQFTFDIARAGARLKPDLYFADNEAVEDPPSAARAAPRAISKMGVEIKTLKSIGGAGRPPESIENNMIEWEKIAALHGADTKLDAASIALINAQYTSIDASDGKVSRIVRNLERSLALDTVRNQYLMHARLHQWFVDGSVGQDVETLNDRVYARLFLTPGSDPWLGLVSPDTYTGLMNDGIVPNR